MANRNRTKPVLKKFKLDPKYPHNRSEGLTWRTNKGTKYQERK